jgi:hypothetical protein
MPTKASLWQKWLRHMGSPCSDSDVREARAWFDELYDAGRKGQYLKTHACGEPLSYDEREVLDLGLRERRHDH